MRTVYEFSVKDRKGKDVSLKEYANEVLLIVNTATKCGFTPQYEELENLYEKYHSQGFEILDFPCNQFGQQAPGTDESIHQFCKLTYGTEFSRFKKIKVNGDDAAPLYKFLKEVKGFAGWDESLPCPRQDAERGRPQLQGECRHQVELHQVPHQQERSGCCPL
jgi:glutathione peroxidase